MFFGLFLFNSLATLAYQANNLFRPLFVVHVARLSLNASKNLKTFGFTMLCSNNCGKIFVFHVLGTSFFSAVGNTKKAFVPVFRFRIHMSAFGSVVPFC